MAAAKMDGGHLIKSDIIDTDNRDKHVRYTSRSGN